jgi:hypothetical protein
MHNRFSGSFAEGLVKVIAVVFAQVIADKGLASVFVDPLQYLLADIPINSRTTEPILISAAPYLVSSSVS